MREYLLGNAAIARGLLEAGVGLVAGYPGTPSSEIIETLVDLKGDLPLHLEWSVNEKVALEVAAGASWTGARAAATMKHVGLNVAADPFMTLAYLGVGAGLVVISADDPYCHSSQNEQDSRRYAQFASIPCLDPADPQEAKDMAAYGFELSEKFNIPVMLRPTTRVSHARADVEYQYAKCLQGQKQFVKNPARRVALPVHARPLHTELLEKQAKMEAELEKAPWNKLQLRGSTGIIASGIAGIYAEEAIRDLDEDVSLLRLGCYPMPHRLIVRMLEHVSRVMVLEELEPVVEEQVERVARKVNPTVEILGKEGSIPREGELDFLMVRNAIARMQGLAERAPRSSFAEKILPPRPPALCPGCSHRATYYAMRRVFGKKAIYPSDIGCYTMAVGMGTVDTCLCMGGSITLASGIRFAGETEGICASLGDSTFLHSGLTGLMNAAYNKARITVTILDNSTTAMTGHQPHPGTGVTATGELTVQVSLEALARALGAGFVETADPYDMEATMDCFQRAKEFDGLSVVIARQPCVIRARRSGGKRKVFSIGADCGGCRVCLEFGCPAIEFSGDAARINNLCTGCGVCAKI
ncbi:Indolepyruvate oxidoreductase subunit IorA [uncultured archaeon]|nr:Indolepyruvate oxidoreductase subunit IorA [uncultured archaeon]